MPGEDYQRTTHDKIFIASNASRLVPDGLDQSVDALTAVAVRGDGAAITRGLQGLIPEFRPPDAGDSIQQASPPILVNGFTATQASKPGFFPAAAPQAAVK